MTNLISFINNAKYVTEERTCVVFGCGRGGTSALAGGLRELGFTMPFAHPLKHEWSPITNSSSSVLDEIKEKVLALNLQHSKWGWKSPKDIFAALEFLPLLRNPIAFVIIRNPLDVAMSMRKYDGIDVEVAFDEAMKAYGEVAKFISNTYHPCAVLSYESLISRPLDIFRMINENYSLGCTSDDLKRSSLFVEKSKGYNSISSEQRDLEFSRKELLTDRKNAQDRVYPPLIANLAQATALIEADIMLAKSNLTHHIDELFKLTRERNKTLNLAINENVLYQLFSLSRFEFNKTLNIDAAVSSDVLDISANDHETSFHFEYFSDDNNEIFKNEENLSRKIYHMTKIKFLAARMKRQRIQDEIEEVISRSMLLRNLNRNDLIHI